MVIPGIENEIRKGIAKLQNVVEGTAPKSSFDTETYITLYTTIHDLLATEEADPEQIFEMYITIIIDYIESKILPSLSSKHSVVLLTEFCRRWNDYKIIARFLSHIFGYMERVIPGTGLPRLKESGPSCFLLQVYLTQKASLRRAVISVIEKDRENGCRIYKSLLKEVFGILFEIGVYAYEEDFDAFIVEDAISYYSRNAAMWVQEYSFPDYMRKVQECFEIEIEYVRDFLKPISEAKVMEQIRHELLVVPQMQLLENEDSGCRQLLAANKVDDLSNMFLIYSKLPQCLEPIVAIFRQHVTDEGIALLQHAEEAGDEQEQTLVWKLIELHDRFTGYVTNVFQNNDLFHQALKLAFGVFCNKKTAGVSIAELLAVFLDNLLNKHGSEKLSDDAVEETLDKIVKLVGYIHGRDIFAEFHRKKLARRLLLDPRSNQDHERSLVAKLKLRFGRLFTSMMEGMFTDLTLSKGHLDNFQEYLKDSPEQHSGIDFSVTVLANGYWPSYKVININLPAEMEKCISAFKGYYKMSTKDRELRCIYSLGTCHVLGEFNQKPIELIVSEFQAAVLLLFNSNDRLSFSEIREHLNVRTEDLMRLLGSLSCGKYKILTKEPNTRAISISDCFEFNPRFTDRRKRVRVPVPVTDERKKTAEDVRKDRRCTIDTAVLRIMKHRKVLSIQQLVSECVEQLSGKFRPNIRYIKKRVETLIKREFMKRDKDNNSILRYLA